MKTRRWGILISCERDLWATWNANYVQARVKQALNDLGMTNIQIVVDEIKDE